MNSLENLTGKRFTTGLMAETDIHNAGTIFGIIFKEILMFGKGGHVVLFNEVLHDRTAFQSWSESIMNKKLFGICSQEEKHVKCVFHTGVTGYTHEMYFILIEENLILAEEWHVTSDSSSHASKVFSLIGTGM